jgi:hypothetical protein
MAGSPSPVGRLPPDHCSRSPIYVFTIPIEATACALEEVENREAHHLSGGVVVMNDARRSA